MAIQTYFNLWTRKEATWDTDKEGHIFITFKEGFRGVLSEGTDEKGRPTRTELSLGYGHFSYQPKGIEAAFAEVDRLEAQYPQVAGTLRVIKAPCMFSRSDCWIDLQRPSFVQTNQ